VFLGCGGGAAVHTSTNPPLVAQTPPPSFHSDSETCGTCHKTIYNEWKNSRHAQSWTSETFRLASENYTKQECLPCHAPELLLKTGFDRQPDLRDEVRDLGVTCIVCHQDPTANEWTMHGPYAVDSPGHKSVENPAFATADTCAPCHGQKAEFDQYHPWKESSFGQSGFTCQVCHASPSERLLAETEPSKPLRWVADHRFIGAYDATVLRSAVTLSLQPEEGGFRVSMVNETGHAFPGGAYREATLTVTVGGNVLDRVVLSFESSRRLAAGETWSKTYPLPANASLETAKATLHFRRTLGDDPGLVIAEAAP